MMWNVFLIVEVTHGIRCIASLSTSHHSCSVVSSAQWDALLKLKTVVEPGQVMSLCPPDDGDDDILAFAEPSSYRVYVRQCHSKLAKLVMDVLVCATGKVAITGTPGIGKSVFLWYLVHRMLLDERFKGRDFVYIAPEISITLTRNGAFEGAPSDISKSGRYISLIDGRVGLGKKKAKYVVL